MANEFKIKKGLIVTGASGGTVVDIQGSQGQLFSVTDNLSGSIFAVSDISGVPIFDVNSSGISYFDGEVGIGTNSPVKKLQVSSDITYDGIQISGASIPTLAIIDTTNNAKLVAYARDSDATVGTETSHPLTINTNNTTALTLDTSQNATFAGNIKINSGTDAGSQLSLFADSNGHTSLAGYTFEINTGNNNSRTRSFYIDNSKNATFSTQAFATTATSSGDASSTLTTKGYVDSLITGATIYRGAWDPSGGGYGSPDLSGVTQTSGYYYICSAAGTAEPNGTGTEPDSWAVGDWVIYNDVSGTGQWQKIDNSSVLSGAGTGQTVALWEGAGSVTDSETLGNAPITVSGNDTTFGGGISMTDSILIDYTGSDGQGIDAGVKVMNDASDWGMYVRKDSSADYGIRIDSGGANAFNIYSTTGGSTKTFGVNGGTGATAISGTESLLLTLNPTANNYGGIWFKYGGVSKGMSIYNSGSMIYGGESGVGTKLQAAGSTALTINTSLNSTFAGTVTSPTFLGDLNGTINTATTGTTQTAGDNSTKIATTAYADAAAAAIPIGNYLPLSAGSSYPVTGPAYFTAQGAAAYGSINLESEDPFIRLYDNGSGSATDKKKWDIRAIGATGYESFDIRTVNDANTVFSTKLSIAHGGNVGIGTTSPDNILHVRASDTGYASQVGADTMLILETTNISNSLQFSSTTSGNQYIMFGDDDPNAGWIAYAHSDNNLNFRTAGSERMRIDSSGNVGIGISPVSGARLTLGTGLVANEILSFAPASGGNAELRNTSSTGTFTFTNSDGSSEKMRILANGNVGIGTTSPSRDGLNVFHTSSPYVHLTNTTTGDGAGDGGYLSMVGNEFRLGNQEAGGALSLFTNNSTGNGIYIPSNGNVGIGTTSPNSKLDVRRSGSGVALELHQTSGSANDYVDLKMIAGNTTAGTLGTILRHKRDGSGGGDFSILTNPTLTGTPTEKLTIKSGGNVGIGTTNPGAKLDIQGTQGQLFSVTDDLSGEIFAVADISGVPIMTVNSSGVSYFDGNVGIGTNSPLNSLDVYRATGDASIRIEAATAADSTILKFRNLNADADITVDYTTGNRSRMVFNTDNDGGYVPVLSLEDNRDTLMYGDVGINTTSPNTRLHVNGSTRVTGDLFFDATSTTAYKIQKDGTSLEIWGNAIVPAIEVLDGSFLKLGSYALSGLGTPTHLLGVTSTGQVVKTTSGSDLPGGPYLPLSGGTMTGDLYLDDGDGATPSIYFNNGANNFWRYLMESGGDFSIKEGTSIRLTFQAGGNVGIGTTSPSVKLEVANKSLTRHSSSSWGQSAIANPNDAEVAFVWAAGGTGYPGLTSTYTRQWIAGLSPFSTGTDRWSLTNKTLGANTAITVLEDGKIGMGTISPTAKLSVIGDINFGGGNNNGIIEVSGSGDLIFKYKGSDPALTLDGGAVKTIVHNRLDALDIVAINNPSNNESILNIRDDDSSSNGHIAFENSSEITGIVSSGTDFINFRTGDGVAMTDSPMLTMFPNRIGINTTSPNSNVSLDVDGRVLIKDSDGVGDLYLGNYATNKHFRFHTNNSATYFDMNCGTINWREGSSVRYYFYPSTANMTINGTLTQNSDERVKENIVEIGDCISKVQAMKGVYYNRTDFNTDITKVGVIAQDVEAVLPELILEAPDTGLKSVAYAELTAVLINAIKEQQEIIEDLKTRVQQLEN